MKYRETLLLLAALLSACVTVPGSAPPLPPPITSEAAVVDKAYVIGVDDRVQVGARASRPQFAAGTAAVPLSF